MTSPVSLILGAAGTGKTTALKALGEAAVRLGLRLHQMALAGRAAARLREATGRPATTIAAFLASAQRGDSPGQDDLVVIDEASMLDLPLLYRVLRSLGDGCRLLLVGDPHQLPPIGFGLTFHVLAEHPGVPRAVLARIHRQAEESGIPTVAAAIRNASPLNLPAYEPDMADGVAFLESAPDEILDALTSVAADLAHLDGNTQILSAVRGGAGGVEAINAHFHGLRSVGRDRVRGRLLAVGDPVLFVRNDYEKGLWNGSVGRLLRVQADLSQAEFEGRVHLLGPDDLRNVALAYCLTVHKAQGSQFDRVVIPILPGVRLDRTMLYTGLTRAVRQVVLVGSRRALEAAIVSEGATEGRETGFRAALDAALAA